MTNKKLRRDHNYRWKVFIKLQHCDVSTTNSTSVTGVKAYLHKHEIINETSDVGRPTVAANVSRLMFQTLLDPNDNVWDTSGSYWTTIKTNSSHWFPTNSPYYIFYKWQVQWLLSEIFFYATVGIGQLGLRV